MKNSNIFDWKHNFNESYVSRANLIFWYFLSEEYKYDNFKNDKIEKNENECQRSMFVYGYK